MDRNEKSRYQACSAPTSGAEETPAGDSELAQNIWGRYGHSPGVIPTAVTLGLARRITRLSTDRIPLLADIQRRWTVADVSFPGGWSALPYARPIAFPGTLSMSANTALPASAAGVSNVGHAGQVPLSGPLAGSQRIVSALPTKEQNSVNRPVVEKAKRLSIHSSTSQGEEAPLSANRIPGTLSMPANTALPASAAGVSNVGHAGQVPLSGPLAGSQRIVSALPTKEQNSVNRPVVEKAKRLSIHSSTSQGEEAPKLQASATEVQDANKIQTALSEVTIGGDLGATIVRRLLSASAERPLRGLELESRPSTRAEQFAVYADPKSYTSEIAEPKRMHVHDPIDIQQQAEGLDSPSRGVLEKGPMAGMENHSTEAKNSTYPMTGQNAEPSTSLSKDTLKLQPAVQKTQHGSDVVEIQTGVSIMTNANNLGTPILQRFMDGPAGRVARRTSEFFGEAAPTISLGGEMPMQQPATGKIRSGSDVQNTQTKMPIIATSSSLGVAILRRNLNGPAGPVMQGIPLFRSALTGTGAFINARPLMGPSSEGLPEMPFVKADDHISRKIEPQLNSFSSPIAMPLQRGVADASANMLANELPSTVSTQDVNEPSSLSMVEPDTENLDLEHLANEVYAIIEQRITIERENLGI